MPAALRLHRRDRLRQLPGRAEDRHDARRGVRRDRAVRRAARSDRRVITGSTARAAFDDALATLAARDHLATRPPFDYDPSPTPPDARAWLPPRASLLVDRASPIIDSWQALRTGRTTVRSLVDQARAAAAETVAAGGLVEPCDDAPAIADALDAALAAGDDRGPLHGIPITVKDVIDVAGTATRAGSDAYFQVPSADAWAVARLRAAGAVIVGKDRK